MIEILSQPNFIRSIWLKIYLQNLSAYEIVHIKLKNSEIEILS